MARSDDYCVPMSAKEHAAVPEKSGKAAAMEQLHKLYSIFL